MEFLPYYENELRLGMEFILAAVSVKYCIKYRLARKEALLICQIGKNFLRGNSFGVPAGISTSEGRSLVRWLQISSKQMKRETLLEPVHIGIEIEDHHRLEELGMALQNAINNQAAVRPQATRIFHRKDGKLTLISQCGLSSGRLGRVIVELVEDHQFLSGEPTSTDDRVSLKAFGIYQQFLTRFFLPESKEEELILWLGFNKPRLSGFKEQKIVFETLAKNLSVVINQSYKIASLQKVLEDERDAFLGISHDLKAPGITALYLIRELQSKLAEPDSSRKAYDDLEILVLEQLSLIHDYLDIERSRSTVISPAPQLFRIEEFVRDISGSPLVRHDKNKAQFRVEVAAQGMVRFDRGHLKRIILNLISNALKYSHEGIVTFGVRAKRAEDIELYVSDTGRGIPSELAHNLFSKFQRLEAPSNIGGNGIGLAASQLLAERNGTRLQYEPRREGGSLFSLVIPRPIEEVESSRKLRGSPTHSSRRALIVEDDEATCRLYSRILSSNGYQVEIQSSIQGAWSKLSSGERYVALIMDFRLPDGESFTLLKEMSQKGIALPTLVISGVTEWARHYERAREIMEGVFSVRFLEKPVEREEFEREFLGLIEYNSLMALEHNLRG